LNGEVALISLSILAALYIIRLVLVKLFIQKDIFPQVFLAPRGLITILLFLYISSSDRIDLMNRPLLIQVILLTVLIMMFGLMLGNKKDALELFGARWNGTVHKHDEAGGKFADLKVKEGYVSTQESDSPEGSIDSEE
jgi:hypothetical protein